MAKKRTKISEDQFDANVERHLKSLGLNSVEEYQQWCANHGFSRKLKKSQADRRRERNVTKDGRGRDHQRFSEQPRKNGETLVRLFGEKILRSGLNSKQQKLLYATAQRLAQVIPESSWRQTSALKQLVHACLDRRLKFIRSCQAPSIAYESCTYLEALASVAIFSDDWIRPLETWKVRTHNPRRQFNSLLSHLFVTHDIPGFFFNEWLHRDPKLGLNNQSAFVHVGAGHSIRRLRLPLTFSKRMGHHFMRAPSECTYRQALRWGQVHGLGGDEALARAVMGTFLGSNFRNEDFWSTVIQWFVDHPMFDRHWFHVVIDYLNNQRFGVGELTRIEIAANGDRVEVRDPPNQPNLTMKGRTPVALLRDVNRWHERLQSVSVEKSSLKWEHSGISEFRLVEGQKAQTIWTIRQLLNTGAMVQEGQKMNHCVASYVQSCSRRRTSIWSMRKEFKGVDQRVLTVEVGLPGLHIRQIRGKSNRLPTQTELQIIRRWAQAAELKLTNFF